MADKKGKEWRELTFSQREGKAPLPEPLQVGELTRKFRRNLWAVIETSISNSQTPLYTHTGFDDSDQGNFWGKCSYSYYFDLLDQNHDEIFSEDPGFPADFSNVMREIILDGKYHEVLKVVEHMLRTSEIPNELAKSITNVFEHTLYFIDSAAQPVCIISSTSAEMKESVKQSLDRINDSELTGAKSHLRKATEKLNSNNFADSVRDSIHAVEGAVRQICPEDSKNFSSALDSLGKNGMIKHPALKAAFQNLYGYTSGEQGIRHPLIDKETADVGLDEAIFMYGACVSFVDYLVSKHRQSQDK